MSFVIETKIFEDKEASIKNMFFIEVKFKLNYKELENLFEESFKSVVREIVDFIFNITNIAVQAICIAGLSLIIIYTPFDELGIALVTFLNMLKNSPLPANV